MIRSGSGFDLTEYWRLPWDKSHREQLSDRFNIIAAIHLGRDREARDEGERGCREVPIRRVQVKSVMLNAETAG